MMRGNNLHNLACGWTKVKLGELELRGMECGGEYLVVPCTAIEVAS